MAPTSKKRALHHFDDDEDIGVPASLGVDDASLPGSKKKRPPPPPEDRELDLEKLIFGDSQLLSAPASSSRKPLDTPYRHQQQEDVAEDADGSAQQGIADDQLFMLDTGAGSDDEDDENEGRGDDDDEIDYEAGSSDDDAEQILIDGPGKSSEAARASTEAKKPRKASVWTDPDDATLTIALTGRDAVAVDGSKRGTKKLRRLREEVGENSISGQEYELRLRKQFEKLHPRPMWASLRLFTRQQQDESPDGADDDPSFTITDESSRTLNDLLRSDSGLLGTYSDANGKSIKARGKLKAGEIEVDRLRDANSAQTSFAAANDEAAAAIEMLQFHPSERASVLMTASRDRRVRLFQIDGNTNPLVQTLHVPDMPIQHASFHPSGSSVLISGTRPYLYAYDLQAGRVIRSSPWRGSGSVVASNSGDDGIERDLSMARFQPGTGEGGNRLLAIGGRNGNVHLLDWGRSGASGGALVGGFRMNSPLAGLCWDPSSQYDRGVDVRRGKDHELLTLSAEGSVHIWDIRNTGAEVSCVSIWKDQGIYGAKGLEISPNGKFWSVGSDNGIVNIYKRPSSRAGASDEVKYDVNQAPGGLIEPLKEIGNLTTASTTLRWNHDGQVLALASRNKKDVLKLVHFPTMKVFSNWPTSGTPLGHVTAVDFSRGSQYMAIGNGKGKVLLYALRHYL
ncbi:U3 snoRNP protein [Thecaphora frezii]